MVAIVLLSSCVTTKKYKKLDTAYMSEKGQRKKLQTDFSNSQREFQTCLSDNKKIKEELAHCKKMNEKLTGKIGLKGKSLPI